jgi:hypothetical protein
LGENAVKKILCILLSAFALVMVRDFNPASALADGNVGIPLSALAGSFSLHSEGFFTLCFNGGFTATESCSAADAQPIAFDFAGVGQATVDQNGNACASFSQAFFFNGGDAHTNVATLHLVGKTTAYDAATASGDNSVTAYTGGKCKGSKFDSTGASIDSTSTNHIVASDGGKRIDSVTTSLTNPEGSLGGFAESGFALRQ